MLASASQQAIDAAVRLLYLNWIIVLRTNWLNNSTIEAAVTIDVLYIIKEEVTEGK